MKCSRFGRAELWRLQPGQGVGQHSPANRKPPCAAGVFLARIVDEWIGSSDMRRLLISTASLLVGAAAHAQTTADRNGNDPPPRIWLAGNTSTNTSTNTSNNTSSRGSSYVHTHTWSVDSDDGRRRQSVGGQRASSVICLATSVDTAAATKRAQSQPIRTPTPDILDRRILNPGGSDSPRVRKSSTPAGTLRNANGGIPPERVLRCRNTTRGTYTKLHDSWSCPSRT